MRFVFQRPLWLELTAFSLALMGFCGHLMGLWRLSLGIGLSLKIRLLQVCLAVLEIIFNDASRTIRNIKETIYVFQSFLRQPEWFQTWYYASGVLELVVSTILLLIGMFFWTKKRYAVRLFYIFISLSIAIHILNISFSLLVSEGAGFMKMLLDFPFMLWKAALLPVIYFADKSILGTHAKERVDFKI